MWYGTTNIPYADERNLRHRSSSNTTMTIKFIFYCYYIGFYPFFEMADCALDMRTLHRQLQLKTKIEISQRTEEKGHMSRIMWNAWKRTMCTKTNTIILDRHIFYVNICFQFSMITMHAYIIAQCIRILH